jgi:hypothetical protein
MGLHVIRGDNKVEVLGDLVVAAAQPVLLSYWELISLPPVIIILFIINRWLGRSRSAFYQPITNRNSTGMGATSS